MTEEHIEVFISKYALTAGIEKKTVKQSADTPSMVRGMGVYEHFHGDDWHLTWEAAAAKADAMRIKKIASLKKQIAKLEKLSFVERQS